MCPSFSGADDEVDIENLSVTLGGSATNFAVAVSTTRFKFRNNGKNWKGSLWKLSSHPNSKTKKLTQKD